MPALTASRYPLALRALHWLVAALVAVQLLLGWAAERLDDRQVAAALLHAHFQLGVIVLALVLARLALRLVLRVPVTHATPGWERRAATCVHGALYALLLLLPTSGYVIWRWMHADRHLFGAVELPALFTPPLHDETGRAIAWYVHVGGAWALAVLIALHVAAAAFHQWGLRDRLTHRRMGFAEEDPSRHDATATGTNTRA